MFRLGRCFFFKQFGLLPAVEDAISAMGILVPTSAQNFAIPKLLARENLMLISQTGRGKTLAFLAPIVDQLLRENTDNVFPLSEKPRAVVLVPTRELASQTLHVARKFFGHLISSQALAPGILSFVKERRMLTSGVDLLIATPSRLSLHLDRKNCNFSKLGFCIVDEIDSFSDEVFSSQVSKIVASTNACVALVGATRTVAVSDWVASSKLSIQTDNAIHVLPAGLSQTFVPMGRRKRTDCLKDILLGDQTGKTLIFVNGKSTCDFVARRIGADAFHGSLPRKIRRMHFSKFQKAQKAVLVCTNLASRGLDLGKVDHVVMYDLPDNVADYLHRAGRTARAGATGRVTSLVSARDAPLMKLLSQR